MSPEHIPYHSQQGISTLKPTIELTAAMASVNDTSAAEISGMLNGMALPSAATLRHQERSGVTESSPVSPAKRKRVANLVSKQGPLPTGSGKLKRPSRFQGDKMKDGRRMSTSNDIFDISNAAVVNDAVPGRKLPRETRKSDRGVVRGKGRPRKIKGVQFAQSRGREKIPPIRNIRNLRSSALPEDGIKNPDWSRRPEHASGSKRRIRVHVVNTEKHSITTPALRSSSRKLGPNPEGDLSGNQAQETQSGQHELLRQSPVNAELGGSIDQADGYDTAQDSATQREQVGQDESDELSEDSDGAEDNKDRSDADCDDNLQFFGAYNAWRMVLTSARKVVRFSEANEQDGVMLPLKTTTGKRFVRSVEKVSSVYKKLASPEDRAYENRKEAQRQLSERLDRLDERVENLWKHRAAGKGERAATIRDIYSHVIPSLVMLLQNTYQCLNDEYSKPTNTRALREIIRVQSLTIEVCEIARAWKVKPTTNIPIIKPTSQGIFPYLRDVRKAFQGELQSREERFKQQKNYAELARSHIDVRRADAKAREENERLRKQRCKEMRDTLLRNERELFGGLTPRPSVRDEPDGLLVADDNAVSTREPEVPNQSRLQCISSHPDLGSAGMWTQEEEVELLKQLLRLQHLQG